MVECGGLENRCTVRYRGFESLPLRKEIRGSRSRSGREFLFLEGAFENKIFEKRLREVRVGAKNLYLLYSDFI